MYYLKLRFLILFSFTALLANASDYYITTVDLNVRSGAGKNYKSLIVLAKGDTVKLLESTDDIWAKIQYEDKIGYSSKQYLQKIEVAEIETETETETNSGKGFLVFLILLTITIIAAISLKKSGDKYRNKSTATLLSFFFGFAGLQKFYFGQSNKGILSIVFCWTFIPMLIGLIDFIKLASTSESKFNYKYNFGKISGNQNKQVFTEQKKNYSKQQVIQTYTVNSHKKETTQTDNSIIDVNTENFNLSVEKSPSKSEKLIEPPYWRHSYVYSYNEINYATKQQKEFYNYLKRKVLNGEFVDIKGNTNYAFILYFDFLNEYQKHRDIKLLENQFKLIGEICPKTKSYTLGLLQNELRKRSDSYSIDKLKDLEEPRYQFEHGFSDYDPDEYKLGKLYQEKLGLNEREVTLLNKFWNPSNVFTSIEGCCIAIIMQYLFILKELNTLLEENETTLDKELSNFKEKLARRYSKMYGYNRPQYYYERAESDIYLIFFKRIENSVRKVFGHKRKLSDSLPFYDNKLSNEFEERIGITLTELIEKNEHRISKPDLETQIELNTQNVNRWQIEFNELKESFSEKEKDKFIDIITHLEETNQKNPNIENILFEASKFIAKYDKVQSLIYYAKYIYYDLKSKKFDNRKLTKTVQKSLFKTEEQINDFKDIISDLIDNSDIQTAIEKISKIYVPKRKKIELDTKEIKAVEQKHKGTVELLNEYLESGKEEKETIPVETFDDDVQIEIISNKENHSILKSEISLGKVQEELVKRIITNAFAIGQDEVDKYATENGLFKNQLIDSINEACQEFLDGEALIEEDEDNYVIEESYYQEIAK